MSLVVLFGLSRLYSLSLSSLHQTDSAEMGSCKDAGGLLLPCRQLIDTWSGLCLTAGAEHLTMQPCNPDGLFQEFVLDPLTSQLVQGVSSGANVELQCVELSLDAGAPGPVGPPSNKKQRNKKR
jgi:hypothetical protein